MNAGAAVIKQISRAGRRRTVAQPLRTWDASRESLRNFTGKTHRRDAALEMQFTSFGISFRALSGASRDASEEVSVFRPLRCLKRSASSQEDYVSNSSRGVTS